MKTYLSNKCYNYDFAKLFAKKGYAWFSKGDYNLNIIGVRSNNNNKITNSFDDFLIVDYVCSAGHRRVVYPITTDPGIYYMVHNLTSNGCAILVPGQYRGCWEIGLHKGKYKALVQKKPLSVYRDNNKDDIYDLNPDTIEKGVFGINIHRSNEKVTSVLVDKWSAGCQVFSNPVNFTSFMRLCEEQRKRYGNSFTYTLINEEDM